MSRALRSALPIGVLELPDIDWHLRLYVIRADTSEVVDVAALRGHIAEKVRLIESGCLSDEFVYIRSGFVIAHYGRRGVTFSIWHWADWNGSWESFCHAWYCYGRAITEMEFLDRREPVFCHHELKIVATEGFGFLKICDQAADIKEITCGYRHLRLEE